ncbi:MAG: FTR1 family protein [Actinobacteria bacterium]|nr:FTR1 family protein [Actinomycetota bacterium]
MLSTFIIALREGLEAALIVGILVAYLVKTGRKALLAPLWAGVGLAVLVSLATGAFLTITSTELSPRGEEFFAGTTSFLAVGFVTWMVFWMKRTARHLKGQLEGQLSTAVLAGPLALAAAAFFAVVREGLETSLFIYANFKTVSSTPSATVGLLLGLGLAITLGYLIYRSSIKINLSKFFNYTGIALVVVAAGVLSYGIHEYQELGWLPGADFFVWDVTSVIAKESLLGGILAGAIGFDTTTSLLQFVFWAAYLGIVLALYLKPAPVKSVAAKAPVA